MFGELIDSLDDPKIALRLVSALGDPQLTQRLAAAAESFGEPQCDVLALIVRGFLLDASDDHWVQLIGIMNRAEDPGLAAIRAILSKALPQVVA